MKSIVDGPCEESASPEAAIPEESVIVISDDEAEVSLGLGNSVLIVEDREDSFVQERKTLEVVDEELAITFSRKAHVMPHARYDCSTHPFSRMEQETQIPIEKNASFCDECYCYLCDKPASECSNWTTPDYCHCNAHNKSKHWKGERDTALAGVLTIFNLDLTEIDSELREAGDKLQYFLLQLEQVYNKYLDGAMGMRESVERCGCLCHKAKTAKCKAECAFKHSLVKFHNYTDVHKVVTDFINQVDEGSPRASAVMLLGVAKELVYHKVLENPLSLQDPVAHVKQSTAVLMTRIVSTLQRLLVLKDYPKILYDKFVSFFQSLRLPPHLFTFTSSLNVLRWDNCLLTSVLAGQNLTGYRTNKGKKECLWEALTVVQSRVKKLEEEKSYRQLVRYLNVVKCSENAGLTALKQKLCLYMCKYGDFSLAAQSLLTTKGMQGSIAKYFTPVLYEFHLTMLRVRSCPPGNELQLPEVWVPQTGELLKKGMLVRTALRILYTNSHLFNNSLCWSILVKVWCTCDKPSKEGRLFPLCLHEPDRLVQQTMMHMSCAVLDELQRQANVHLPGPFHTSYSGTAELVLIVQAVVRYLMTANPPLGGLMKLITAFGPNHWALSLLIEGISPMQELLFQFVTSINKELYEEELQTLALFKTRGPSYVSQLMAVFLLHLSDGVRSIGFHLLDIVLRNLTSIPWTGTVANNLTTNVVPFLHTVRVSSAEHQKLVGVIGRLMTG
ncbi:uncharacterized protein [Dendropsophus ebraccatus]